MKISKLFHNPESGSSGLSDDTTINIDNPVEINGRTAYRATYYLRFQFDSYANSIRIKTATSKLKARFDSYNLHLSGSNTTFQTQDWQVEESDDLVKVHLTHPWRLTKVRTVDARGIDVLRLDGDALSEEPTIKANANTNIAAEFIGQDFALRKKPVYAASDVTPAADLPAQAPAKAAAKGAKGKAVVMKMTMEPDSGFSIEDSVAGSAAVEDSTAVEDISIESVPAHGIKWIRLKSYPTGPRLAVGNVNQALTADTQVINLWNEPGEHTNTPVWLPQSAAEGILQQLQTRLDRYIQQAQAAGDSVSSPVFIPLTIESDTPAQFEFEDLEIEYTLLKTQWDHWDAEQKQAGKQTLRFDGSTLERHPLQLNFPPGAQVEKALIHLGTEINTSSGFAAGALAANLNQAIGTQINQGTKVAKGLDLAQAQHVNKIALAVLPVSETAQLSVQLVENQNGKPRGAVLAKGTVQLTGSNGRQWLLVPLDQTVLLDKTLYWIQVSSVEGSIIWLGNQEAGSTCVDIDGRVNAINTIQLLGELGLGLSTQPDQSPDNLSLQFDGTLQEISGDAVDATSQFSAGLPAVISLLSGESGDVTLYSPEIEYS